MELQETELLEGSRPSQLWRFSPFRPTLGTGMGRVGVVRPGPFATLDRPQGTEVDERRRRVRGGERARLPIRGTVFSVAVLCTAVTLAVILGPADFAYPSSELHVAIEVAFTLVALVAVSLVGGRFRFGGRVHDLALIAALATLAVTSVAFSAVPAVGFGGDGAFADWSATFGLLIAATGLAVACFAPDIRLRRPGRAAIAGALAAGLLVIAAAVIALVVDLPTIGQGLSAASSGGARIQGPAGYLALQIITAALFAAAAFGFAERADRRRDDLLAWIGLGCVFAAFSRVHEFLFPAGATGDLVTADLLRLAFCLALFAGAFGEIAVYQRRMALAAVLDERLRMARGLHDGLAQELAFIKMETRRMAAEAPSGRAAGIALAAQQALDESRTAIAALRRRHDEPFALELSQVAEQLAARCGARLRLDLDARIEVDGERRDPLLRIVREAITNGVRHGHASEVSLELSVGEGVRIVVRDNGIGFEPDGLRRRDSFGLTTMRERAQALGGELEIHSSPGQGTIVEVVLP